MKILITAFEPFDNNSNNYSLDVLKEIKEETYLKKVVLPVEYYNSFKELKLIIDKDKPRYLILLGEARSYQTISYEVIGINELSSKKDSKGFSSNNLKILENGLDGLFSTLDYQLFKNVFNSYNVQVKKSYSAGTYVCNSLLYQTLSYLKDNNLNIKCGFIHLPILKEEEITNVVKSFNKYLKELI